MSEGPSTPSTDRAVRPRPRAFGVAHVWGLLVCWFPLNPFVLHYFSQYFRTDFSVTISNVFVQLGLIVATIFGPFTALLEGRNKEFCWQTAFQLLPVCLGAVVVAALVQVFWRPRSSAGKMFRILIWMTGCFVWLAGGLISVFSNSG